MEVRNGFLFTVYWLTSITGYTSKVTQSVLTAALLFTLKDAIYDASVKLRRKVATK
jgi:hypothetical protein